MDQLKLYFELGLNHVLDWEGYDHVLFLMVLIVPFAFAHWKRVLVLVSVFTLGHTISLLLATYKVVMVDSGLVEFLIAFTIALTALYNLLMYRKHLSSGKSSILLLSTLFFGIIHGLGFSGYFKMIIGRSREKLIPLLEFSLGIEAAQIIVVLVLLALGFLLVDLVKLKRRWWVMGISLLVFIRVAPMLVERMAGIINA